MNIDKIREILEVYGKTINKLDRCPAWDTAGWAEHDEAQERALSAITSELEKSAPRWVSVDERLPEVDDLYLVAIRCFEKDGLISALSDRKPEEEVGNEAEKAE